MDPVTLIVLGVAGVLGYSVLRQRQTEAAAASQPATPTAPTGGQLLGAGLGGLVAGIAIESIGSHMEKREHARESVDIAKQIDARMHGRAAAHEFDGMLAAGATNQEIGTALDNEAGPIDLRLKYALPRTGDEIVSSIHEFYGLWGGEAFSWSLGDTVGTYWFKNYLNRRRTKLQAEMAAEEAAQAAMDAAILEGASQDEAIDAGEVARQEVMTEVTPPPPPPPPEPTNVFSGTKEEGSRWFSLK